MRRTTHTDAPLLDDLVGDAGAFSRDYLFRSPLLCTRPDTLAGALPTSDDLWSGLLDRGIRQPGFRLVRAGDTTGRGGVTREVGTGNRTLTDAIDANAVVDRYRQGDTVVLQGLHHTDPWCARLVTNLSLALDHPTQVNAYLSPPAEQGLDIHFDYHDVFVVQIGGTKRWRVWERLERSVNPLRGPIKIDKPDPDELGEPIMEFVMNPGDVLYLPRGFPHAATTTEEQSDHLTIGMTALTWHRFFRHALDVAAGHGEFRDSLPARSLDPAVFAYPPDPALLAKTLTERDYREWLARAVWKRMPQTRLRPRTSAAPDGLLRFSAGPLAWVTERDDRAVIGIGDRVLTLPTEATPFLVELFSTNAASNIDDPETVDPETVDHGSIDPEAIDQGGLDSDSRRVVLTRLMNEGLLVPA